MDDDQRGKDSHTVVPFLPSCSCSCFSGCLFPSALMDDAHDDDDRQRDGDEVFSAGPMTMINDQTLPWIFLSHSGRQKGSFVIHLYHALVHTKHRPFFDEDTVDSLPAGRPYPERIFQACQASKMGVVVLSEDYITSLWPMLELQHLLAPSSSNWRIYPLFYLLQPADLANPANLKCWKRGWAKQSKTWQLQTHISSDVQIKLDINSWPDNLKKLQCRSGEVRDMHSNDFDYIQKVVSDICAALPPRQQYLHEEGIKGQQRIQQEVARLFQQEGSMGADGVSRIGLYGIAGSGKSTVCKIMADFYGNEFPGKCLYLEFPSEVDETQTQLVAAINSILPALSTYFISGLHLSDIQTAMKYLKQGLELNKFFLAIDNVWDHRGDCSFKNAQMIVLMKCMQGSKILVTSRSKEILKRLLPNAMNGQHADQPPLQHDQTASVWQVPSLNKEEAIEALEGYSCFSHLIPKDCLLRNLADSCFYDGHCHPLVLSNSGADLRIKGRVSFDVEHWEDLIDSLIRCLAASESEETILVLTKKLLEGLPSQLLLDIFIELATCEHFLGAEPDQPIWYFLRYHLDVDLTLDEMRLKVLELEYHGLLQLCETNDYGESVIIHDLHRRAAATKLKASGRSTNALAKCAIEGDLSTKSSHEIVMQRHVAGHDPNSTTL